jgi:hypothetical protein
MPRKLDRQKPYATVAKGNDFSIKHTYEQDNAYFDHEGCELDKATGERLDQPKLPGVVPEKPKPAPPASSVKQPAPKAPEPMLTYGRQIEPEIIAFELDGEPITLNPEDNTLNRDEMMAMLDNLGAKYYRRDTKKSLFVKLLAAAKDYADNE